MNCSLCTLETANFAYICSSSNCLLPSSFYPDLHFLTYDISGYIFAMCSCLSASLAIWCVYCMIVERRRLISSHHVLKSNHREIIYRVRSISQFKVFRIHVVFSLSTLITAISLLVDPFGFEQTYNPAVFNFFYTLYNMTIIIVTLQLPWRWLKILMPEYTECIRLATIISCLFYFIFHFILIALKKINIANFFGGVIVVLLSICFLYAGVKLSNKINQTVDISTTPSVKGVNVSITLSNSVHNENNEMLLISRRILYEMGLCAFGAVLAIVVALYAFITGVGRNGNPLAFYVGMGLQRLMQFYFFFLFTWLWRPSRFLDNNEHRGKKGGKNTTRKLLSHQLSKNKISISIRESHNNNGMDNESLDVGPSPLRQLG